MNKSKSCKQFVALLLTGFAFLAFAPVHAGDIDDDWQITFHPCPGPSRTDALQKDPDGRLWVGCGTNANGFGLFTSPDGADTWQAVSTSPANVVDEFRVYTLTRGHDGALYASGVDTTEGTSLRSVRLDTTGSMPYPATPNLIAVAQVGRQFNVGGYAELQDGQALASSETGFDRLYRPDSSTGPSAADWTIADTTNEAYRDVVAFDGGFYASGSRINIPPRVFVPNGGHSPDIWDLKEVILDDAYDGEMWGIAVNAQRLVAVGVDQDSDTGKIYVSNGNDPGNAANYDVFNMPDIVGTSGIGTWARGVCMRDDVIVVVGERQPLGSNTGRMMISTDGGQSFNNITPSTTSESITRCAIAESGLVTVVGAGGFVGRYSGALVPDQIFMDDFEVNSYIPLR